MRALINLVELGPVAERLISFVFLAHSTWTRTRDLRVSSSKRNGFTELIHPKHQQGERGYAQHRVLDTCPRARRQTEYQDNRGQAAHERQVKTTDKR